MFRPEDASAEPARRLAPFAFASGLAPARLAFLADRSRDVTFAAGAALLDEGAACDPLVFVERGAIRVFKRAPSGREISLYRVEAGEACVLAMSGVLGRTTYPASAAVDADIRGLAVPAAAFRDVYAAEPALQRFVMDLVARRISVLMTLVAEVAFARMDHRLAQYLVERAERSPGVVVPVERTHEQIASELGSAREVVSRLLRSFEERGLVELGRGRIRIREVDSLRRLD